MRVDAPHVHEFLLIAVMMREFVADAIRNGLVAQAITANGVRGGSVAPLA